MDTVQMQQYCFFIYAALAALLLVTVNSQVYYITNSPSDPCLVETCMTLSQFAANADSYVASNTTLMFQPGNHSLDSELLISSVRQFLMSPFSNSNLPFSATINCKQSGKFEFQDSNEIVVSNLTFIGCEGNRVVQVKQFTIDKSNFIGEESRKRVFEIRGSSALITRSSFTGCKVGGVLYLYNATLNVSDSNFSNSRAVDGGAIFLFEATLNIDHSMFESNLADKVGGAIYASNSKVNVSRSLFTNNVANDSAAIHTAEFSTLYINSSKFHKNVAGNMGGAVSAYTRSWLNLLASVFSENVAKYGGALNAYESWVDIDRNLFVSNKAETGGVFYASKSPITTRNISIVNNTAESGVIFILGSSANFSSHTSYSNNVGSILVFNSIVIFTGNVNFIENDCVSMKFNTTATSVEEGGALTAFQSQITFDGTCALHQNRANKGGAIHATESTLYLYGDIAVANNTAEESGGGMYLCQSELVCQDYSTVKLLGNGAIENGGGIHATSSFIYVQFSVSSYITYSASVHYYYTGSLLNFTENRAAKGGGISLEAQAKVYILKNDLYRDPKHPLYVLIYSSNLAEQGGAVYVSDETNSGTCASTSYNVHSAITECFLQTLALHGQRDSRLNLVSTKFEQNHATISGSTLFGGLVDRCTASSFSEEYYKYKEGSELNSVGGLGYLLSTTNIQNSIESISSAAVRLCFCQGSRPDCSYRPSPIQVKKGENFTVTLVAVDQVNNTIANTTIHSYLSSREGGLDDGQLIQNTGEGCTDLTFAAHSPHKLEELIMYAEGPCENADMSQLKQDIKFLPCSCPVGFEPNSLEQKKCDCECDSRLRPYITECYDRSETLIREGDFWITYLNESNSYLVYPHCPQDYCQPPSSKVNINMNVPNGSDAQCALHRFGVLCGACKSGLSLSLDSSDCVTCPSYWPVMLAVILVAVFLAGLVLVALVLMLNLTVAVGTLNGIIFYANVININRSLFFPFPTPNFVTVFISWLNLELGFDICFFEGMDAYWKMWLQLAFPAYIIFLVVMVIILGEFSQNFAHLIGKKNPVATLATLVWLSYAKLLHTVIGALSFAILDYPDGSHEVVWLPDANVKYFRGKHVPLFIAAILILAICITYTVLLFSWQWLLRYQDKKLFKWTRNQKLHLFLKPYHAPYTINHRYWTGLLLLVRAVLSISSALNVSNDPGVNLLVLGIVMIFLLLLVGRCSPIYERAAIEFLEVAVYANIIALFAINLYILEAGKDQTIVAYILGTVGLIQFLVVVAYHVFTKFISKTRCCKLLCNQNEGATNLLSYPPVEADGRNLARPTFTVLDLSQGNRIPLIDESNLIRESYLSTYGSNSWTEIRSHSNESEVY